MAMKLSNEGLEFIKGEEERSGKPHLMPYDDGAGNMTIGYGHKIQPGGNSEGIRGQVSTFDK